MASTLDLPRKKRVAVAKADGLMTPMPQTEVMEHDLGDGGPSKSLKAMAYEQAPFLKGRGDRDGYGMDRKYLNYARDAEQQARSWRENTSTRAWASSYRAYRNEHFEGSKYLSKEWAGRSRIFRPKTRVSVRKSMATGAAALFSTSDTVKIGAGNDADELQAGAAALMQQLINYRLSRQSHQGAVPWFLVSMGAKQDASVTGICFSKQCWLHRMAVVPTETYEYDDNDEQVYNEDGTPSMITVDEEIVEVDRPEVLLYPPENVLIDPTAPWLNAVQGAAYIILRSAVHVDTIMEMMAQPFGNVRWLDVPRSVIQNHANANYDSESVRRAREGGRDRFSENKVSGAGHWDIVWLHENFIRCDGVDHHFWSLGTEAYLSEPTPVREIYPEQGGARPITMGYGQIEAHRISPMSEVEAMQPLQQEANDICNLRLDQLKQIVLPVAKIKQGQNVDMDALRRRAPNSAVFMKDPEKDLIWDRPPDVPATAYQEQNFINSDIDDLSGMFSQGSVATNRQLNETVGGMNLLSGNANAVSEFDLRVWTETWVEPTIAQIVKLEQYYESDPVLISLAGDRAQLFKKFGISVVDDFLLTQQVHTTVDVGIGASDPMQRLTKFKAAADIAGPILAPGIQSGQIQVNYKAVVNEVFGAAGYADAGERFITMMDESGMPPPPPDGGEGEAAMAKVEADAAAKQKELELKGQLGAKELEQKERLAQQEFALKARLAEQEAAQKARERQDKAIEAQMQGQQKIQMAREQADQKIMLAREQGAQKMDFQREQGAQQQAFAAQQHDDDMLNQRMGMAQDARMADAAGMREAEQGAMQQDAEGSQIEVLRQIVESQQAASEGLAMALQALAKQVAQSTESNIKMMQGIQDGLNSEKEFVRDKTTNRVTGYRRKAKEPEAPPPE